MLGELTFATFSQLRKRDKHPLRGRRGGQEHRGATRYLLKLRPDERERFDKAVNDRKGQMPPWAACSVVKR